jgi:hypothetical protein
MIALTLTGCSDESAQQSVRDLRENNKQNESKIAELGEAISKITDDVIAQQKTIVDLEKELGAQHRYVIERLNTGKAAEISATQTGYDIIENRYGAFPILVANAVPYLDGQRVTFKIGNPLGASINEGTIKLTYALRKPDYPETASESKDRRMAIWKKGGVKRLVHCFCV